MMLCEDTQNISHLRYGVIVTDYKTRRFIIARMDSEDQPLLFLREWVDAEDDYYDRGRAYYTLWDVALTAFQADEILECLKAGDMRRARMLLKRYLEDCVTICEDANSVVLDDMIPDDWYEAWKQMEGIITMGRHFPGYYEADVVVLES